VEDPILRESLRRLYPEYQPIIQAWLIAEPWAPLPSLADRRLMKKGKVPEIEAGLQESLQRMQAQHPDMHWTVHERRGYNERLFRDLACDIPSDPASDPTTEPSYTPISERSDAYSDDYTITQAEALHTLPEGAIIGYTASASGQTPIIISRIGHGGIVQAAGRSPVGMRYAAYGLELSAPEGPPLEEMTGTSTTRTLNVAAIQRAAATHHHIVEPPRPEQADTMYPGPSMDYTYGEVLADGTPRELDCETVRTGAGAWSVPALQHIDYSNTPSRKIHAAQRDALLRRWSTLTSPEDRRHIAAFWLGHPHPVLAAAGMALLGHHLEEHQTGVHPA
jgi:hypothetical protein